MQRIVSLGFVFLALIRSANAADSPDATRLTEVETRFLGGLEQVTRGLPRAGEGYFSPDGESIVYQAYPVGYPFYQIYTQRLDKKEPRLVSTAKRYCSRRAIPIRRSKKPSSKREQKQQRGAGAAINGISIPIWIFTRSASTAEDSNASPMRQDMMPKEVTPPTESKSFSLRLAMAIPTFTSWTPMARTYGN